MSFKKSPINHQLIPPIDLTMWLEAAYKKGTLLINVPWIVEALRICGGKPSLTPHMKSILRSLISLYQSLNQGVSKTDSDVVIISPVLTKIDTLADEVIYKHTIISNVHLKRSTSFLLIFQIGSIFQNSGVKTDTFYKLCENPRSGTYVHNITSSPLLDCSNFVPKKLIHRFSPAVADLKYTVMQGPVHTAVIKHIRPHKIDSQSPSTERKINETQKLLEDSLFLRYKGLQNTLDLIVDNVTGICKNFIINHILSAEKKNRRAILQNNESTVSREGLLLTIAQTSITNMKTSIDQAIEEHSKDRIPAAVNSLVTPEHGEAFLNVCQEIAQRKFRENLLPWITSILPNEKDIVMELKESETENKQMHVTCSERDFSSSQWFDCMSRLQETLNIIYYMKKAPPDENLIQGIELVKQCDIACLSSKDLTQVYNLTWEIIIFLIALGSKPISDEVLTTYINFWKENQISDIKERVLCERNLSLISKSDSYKITVASLAKLLIRGMEKGLFTADDLGQLAVGVYRFPLQQEQLQVVKDTFKECSNLLKATDHGEVLEFLQLSSDLAEELELEENAS